VDLGSKGGECEIVWNKKKMVRNEKILDESY